MIFTQLTDGNPEVTITISFTLLNLTKTAELKEYALKLPQRIFFNLGKK